MSRLPYISLSSLLALCVLLLTNSTLSQDPCDPKKIEVGSAAGAAGHRVEVSVTGAVSCEVTGFSFAVGHDSEVLRFVSAVPGQFLVDHAGADLSFQGIQHNAEGYMLAYCLFDISNPITVPPTAIPEGTVLATLSYEVLENTPEGVVTLLLNRTRAYGSPNPISNIYSGKPGEAPIEPQLSDGQVTVISVPPEGDFIRGNSNGDLVVDISDPVHSLSYLFLGYEAPPCLDAADSNDDGLVNISDAVYTLSFLFQGGPEPLAPGPFGPPGSDPTPDKLVCTP